MNRKALGARSIGLAAVLALAATACGGSSGGTASGSKKPVKVGVVVEASGAYQATYITEWAVAVHAAADYVNKELGGFGGRTLEVVDCDSQSSAAGALTCANKMVAQDVDFVTGLSLNFGPNGVGILGKAGIPVQMFPIATQDFTAANSFPLAGGSAASYPSRANYATKVLNAKVAAFTAADSGPAQLAGDQLKPYFTSVGGKVVNALVPAASADLNPTIAKIILAKPDVVINSLAGVKGAALYAGLFAQGFDPKKIIGAGSLVDVKSFYSKVSPAAAIEGSLYELQIDSPDNMSNKDIATYRTAMTKYANEDGRAEYTMLGFSDVMTNYNLAKTIGFDKFNKETMTKAYMTGTVPVFGGYQYDRSKAPKDYPAIGNPFVKFVRYEAGKVVAADSGWLNSATGEIVN